MTRNLRIQALFLCAALGLAGCGGEPAEIKPFLSYEKYKEWKEAYYKKPSPDRLPAGIVYYADSDLFKKEDQRVPAAQFFATAFVKSGGNPRKWMQATAEALEGASDNAHALMLLSVWLVDTDDSRELLQELGARWQGPVAAKAFAQTKHRPRDVMQGRITEREHLDRLWEIFYATGKADPVKQIVDALYYLDASEFHGPAQRDLARAAVDSLIERSLSHKDVDIMLRRQVSTATPLQLSVLNEILRRAAALKAKQQKIPEVDFTPWLREYEEPEEPEEPAE